jgi:hypothetical protein
MKKDVQVAARLNNGKVEKGYVRDFRSDAEAIVLYHPETGLNQTIPMEELKAVFFIRSFTGDRNYREKKAFGIRPGSGRKIFLKFRDKETMIGFVQEPLPWRKGFSLFREDGTTDKGFFLEPVDDESNNVKVFVVGSAIEDVTIMVI